MLASYTHTSLIPRLKRPGNEASGAFVPIKDIFSFFITFSRSNTISSTNYCCSFLTIIQTTPTSSNVRRAPYTTLAVSGLQMNIHILPRACWYSSFPISTVCNVATLLSENDAQQHEALQIHSVAGNHWVASSSFGQQVQWQTPPFPHKKVASIQPRMHLSSHICDIRIA